MSARHAWASASLCLALLLGLSLARGAAPPVPGGIHAPPPALVLGESDFVLARHTGGTGAIAVSPDGKVAATSGGDRMVRLWELPTRKPLRAWSPGKDFIRSLTFSPDGKTLAVGGDRPEARLWDVTTGKPLRELKGHANGVYQ